MTDVTPEIIRGERDRSTLLQNHLDKCAKGNVPNIMHVDMTLQATLETEIQDDLNKSEFRNFIKNDFRKKITMIDRMAWNLRENHTKSASEQAADED